jgi:methionyl aminopeptidase
MAITVKNTEEIAIMREGGKILARILKKLKNHIKPGVTTKELDAYAEKLFRQYAVTPSFKDYKGFPANICASVNEEVVHTIPSDKALKDGDIITIDCGVYYKGFNTDSAITVFVGNVPEKTKEFVFVIRKALMEAISKLKEGVAVSVIGDTIQKIVEEKHGYSIIKELTGHGVGRKLHEDPLILNYREYSKGPVLKEGNTIAIEPIASMGSPLITTKKDGWTVVTDDSLPSCQWEHTVLITKNGCEILTK